MTTFLLLIACGIAYVTKLVGYLLPQAWLEQPRVQRTAAGIINSAYGCAGERCMALPVVVAQNSIAVSAS